MEAENKPLEGKRIVVTRAAGQESGLAGALESLGAQVLLLPVIRFAPPENWRDLDAALDAMAAFDWILFTSRNAVRFFLDRARERNISIARAARPKIGAVGPATAQTARAEGLQVDYIAKDHTGESLGRELAQVLRGASVLLPRSNRAGAELPDALRAAGARVTETISYRTAAPEALDPDVSARVRDAKVDAVVFASPSAYQNLAAFFGSAELAALSARIAFAAIGPVTAKAMRDAGARVEIEAADPSAQGVAEAIAAHYSSRAQARPTRAPA
ncbi:MAG TPA: uroporphyrinogen-III synthase [Candidatus Acidoferrales bacterium]|nr:uroporphyrinogen-III synthase [Candidatus Acidoferrales bacterium]